MASSLLNPRAKEWNPKPKPKLSVLTYLPHMIYRNPPPHNTTVAFPAAPPPPPPPPPPPTTMVFSVFRCFPTFHDYAVAPPYGHGGSDVFWKAPPPPPPYRPVLPPRFKGRMLRSMEHSRRRLRQIWRPVKALTANPSSAGDGGDSPLPAGKTTLMIKNIPNQYRRDTFISFLDLYCIQFQLEYDFLYLPMDFKTNNNLGYAFVNFTTADGASIIRDKLKDHQWGVLQTESGFFTSKKICEISWARIQGKEDLVKHFKKSNFICDTMDYLPAVFDPPRNGMSDGGEPEPVGNLVGLYHSRLIKA